MTQQELTNIQDMEDILNKFLILMTSVEEQSIRKDLLRAMDHADLALEHYQKLVSKGD